MKRLYDGLAIFPTEQYPAEFEPGSQIIRQNGEDNRKHEDDIIIPNKKQTETNSLVNEHQEQGGFAAIGKK